MKRILLIVAVLTCILCNAGCTDVNRKEFAFDDRECIDGEIIRYLKMPIQEILDMTDTVIDEESSLVIFEPNVFFPCIEMEPFLIVCRNSDTTYTPIYVALYQDYADSYLEMLQLNSDMSFQDIMEVMGTVPVEESKERADYKNYMISFTNGELEYYFCSDDQDGRGFELYIGLTKIRNLSGEIQ
ncbi:MAG: hypothetical protein K2I21_07310 [Acetatifactor sp.]|nr:hypothetical protein [Acetatifactor sp.]